jgi:uncharacterized membrane protein
MSTAGSESRLLAALGYPLWIVALVVVATDLKKDSFLRHHGWQALFWGIAWFVVWVGLSLLSFLPFLGLLFSFLAGPVLFLVWLVASVLYAVRAYRGERFEVPVVAGLARRYMLGEA